MSLVNHAEYQAKVKTMSREQLLHTIKDCRATLEIWPDCPKAGVYLDEISYCTSELRRRKQKVHRLVQNYFTQ